MKLPAWRAFLHGYWHICAGCGAAGASFVGLPTAGEEMPAGVVKQIEARALAGAPPFLCTACCESAG